jgi:hypothetical protein
MMMVVNSSSVSPPPPPMQRTASMMPGSSLPPKNPTHPLMRRHPLPTPLTPSWLLPLVTRGPTLLLAPHRHKEKLSGL